MLGDFLANSRVDGKLFAKLARECLFESLARFDFTAGEFPLEFMAAAALALADENQAVSFNHRGDDIHFSDNSGVCTPSVCLNIFGMRKTRASCRRRRFARMFRIQHAAICYG